MGAYEKGRNHMVFSIEMIDNSHAEDVKIKNLDNIQDRKNQV